MDERVFGTRALPSGPRTPETSCVARFSDPRSPKAVESPPHLLEQDRESSRKGGRSTDEHHRNAFRQNLLLPSIGFADSPPGPVTCDRSANPATHGKPYVAPLNPRLPECHEARPLFSIALPKECLNLRGSPEPSTSGER